MAETAEATVVNTGTTTVDVASGTAAEAGTGVISDSGIPVDSDTQAKRDALLAQFEAARLKAAAAAETPAPPAQDLPPADYSDIKPRSPVSGKTMEEIRVAAPKLQVVATQATTLKLEPTPATAESVGKPGRIRGAFETLKHLKFPLLGRKKSTGVAEPTPVATPAAINQPDLTADQRFEIAEATANAQAAVKTAEAATAANRPVGEVPPAEPTEPQVTAVPAVASLVETPEATPSDEQGEVLVTVSKADLHSSTPTPS